MNKLESVFKNYIEEKKLTYKKLAKEIGVDVKTLQKYINGELYPNKKIMEKIVIITEGCIQPIDFLLLYRREFNIIDYINHHIGLKIITPKELALELKINYSNLCRRIRGEVSFKEGEIKKILSVVESKKVEVKRYNYNNSGEKYEFV